MKFGVIFTVFLFLLCGCKGLSNNEKKINIEELESLSKKDSSELSKNKKVVLEGSGRGGFYVYESKGKTNSTISVAKKDFKTIEITKSIKNLKDNTIKLYRYSPNGLLQRYIKSVDNKKIKNKIIGEISVFSYVKIFQEFDENGITKKRKNYDEIFKINLENIISIIEKSGYKDIAIFRVYLDQDLTMIPVIGLMQDDLIKEKPYWIIVYRESSRGNNHIIKIYDGISGDFIKEKNVKIFSR